MSGSRGAFLRVAGAGALTALTQPSFAAAQTAAGVPLKVGFVMSLSGPGALLGRSVQGALSAYFAMHGGMTLGGRPVTLITRDDNHAPETARRMAQELIVQQQIDVLVGGTSTPEAVAMGQVSTQAKLPYFIINSSAPGILAPAPYAVRTAFLTDDLAPPLAKWLVQNRLPNVYAMVADYSSGADYLASMTKAMTDAGGRVIGSVAFPLDTVDYSSYMLRAKDAKPNAVFGFPGGGPAAISMIKQFNSNGLRASSKLVGTADLVSDELLNAEADDAVGVVTVSNYSPDHDSKLNHDFVRAYRAALTNPTPEDAPSFIPVQAYDALALIDKIVAAQKGGLDAARSMEILRGIQLESPRGMLSFDPQTREVRQTMYVRRVEKRNGRYMNVEIAAFPPR